MRGIDRSTITVNGFEGSGRGQFQGVISIQTGPEVNYRISNLRLHVASAEFGRDASRSSVGECEWKL